eukprot:GILK01006541.1.p1 GENE.GILK01006541.1~~GILK01006541.1.p1  ORF type:complete len:683 (+),score=94.87 GILK01006541.1:133-2049(+)
MAAPVASAVLDANPTVVVERKVPIQVAHPHSFVEISTSRFSHCDFCGKKLWTWKFSNHVLSCEVCEYRVHAKCSHIAPQNCRRHTDMLPHVFSGQLITDRDQLQKHQKSMEAAATSSFSASAALGRDSEDSIEEEKQAEGSQHGSHHHNHLHEDAAKQAASAMHSAEVLGERSKIAAFQSFTESVLINQQQEASVQQAYAEPRVEGDEHHWIARHRGSYFAKCLFCKQSVGLSERSKCSKCKQKAHTVCAEAPDSILSPCQHGYSTLVATFPLPTKNRPATVVDPNRTPLIAFINSRSGGRLGPDLIRQLRRLLGMRQVFDLAVTHPEEGLSIYRYVPNLRVLVCGGDGTAGWVLTSIERLKMDPAPPIAVLPLGTGNDLARALGFGGAFKLHKLQRLLHTVLKADSGQMDHWEMKFNPIVPETPEVIAQIPPCLSKEFMPDGAQSFTGVFCNYLSFGIDAKIAAKFHHLRETHPGLCRGRMTNQLWYGYFGLTDGGICCGTNPPVRRTIESIQIMDANGQWVPMAVPENIRSLCMINLGSYAGGRDPWGPKLKNTETFQRQSRDDGLIEVFGVRSGWHASFIIARLARAVRLAQTRGIRFKITAGLYYQVDGEPWYANDTTLEITHHKKVRVLQTKP